MMTFEEFKDILVPAFPDVTDRQLARFEQMQALYTEWNSKINVISRKDIDSLYLHHVLHSLAIAKYHPLPSGCSVLDLGTGGGFPGIPLAVLFPDVSFTLCDSVGKKTIVAGAVSKALGLENVEVVNCRAEELGRRFDYVVSRAVTSLDNFYPWVKGCYNQSILYLKGGDVNEEIMTLMNREKLKKGSISTWRVDSWLEDEYFDQKFVIEIGR